MGAAARRSLERIALLVRGLALLLGAIVGGQVYARSGEPLAAVLAGAGAWAAGQLVLQLGLRRYRRLVEALDAEEPPPPPARARRPRGSRRVLTGSGDPEP